MADFNKAGPSGGGATGSSTFFRRRKVILAATAVVAALALLIYVGMSQFATYYVTVSEFMEEGDSVDGKQMRVAGQVVPDSLDWDTENVTLSFVLADGDASLPVVYRGAVPDTFKEDSDVVVEGKYEAEDGTFNATKLVTKCPSKYIPSN
jgi:cytochrome c-type biogenesis protein CcmE